MLQRILIRSGFQFQAIWEISCPEGPLYKTESLHCLQLYTLYDGSEYVDKNHTGGLRMTSYHVDLCLVIEMGQYCAAPTCERIISGSAARNQIRAKRPGLTNVYSNSNHQSGDEKLCRSGSSSLKVQPCLRAPRGMERLDSNRASVLHLHIQVDRQRQGSPAFAYGPDDHRWQEKSQWLGPTVVMSPKMRKSRQAMRSCSRNQENTANGSWCRLCALGVIRSSRLPICDC